jgi:hypothetical protein
MKRLALSTILILLACGTSKGQTTVADDLAIEVPAVLDIGGSGARARGMGGAFIAAGDDASSLTWNPAGLYSLEKTIMTFGYDHLSARGSVESGPLSVPQQGGFGGPGFFSILAPFRIKNHGFVGGISYARTFDEAANGAGDFSFLIDPDGPVPTYPLTLYNMSIRSTYHAQVTPVTVGFGTRLSERVAAGLSANVITGNSVSLYNQHEKADSFFVREYYPQPSNYDFNGTVIDSRKFSVLFFSVGFKYIKPTLSIGAVLKMPYKLRQETDRTIREVTTVNGLVRTDGTVTEFRDGSIVDIEMPLMVGVGAAMKPNAATTLALDVEYRPFSGQELRIRDSIRLVPGAKDEEFFRNHDLKWRNVLIVRAGAERLFTTNSRIFPVVPVRVGIGYMPIPGANKTADDVPSGTASGINLSLGTGVQWSQLHVDLAYSYRTLKRTFGTTEFNGKSHYTYLTFTGYF